MKRIKKIMLCMVTVMTFCLMFANALIVSAATEKTPGGVYVEAYKDVKGNWKNTSKLRMTSYSFDGISVEYAAGDKITKLKVNKKNGLKAKVTSQSSDAENYKDGTSYSYGSSYIELFAEKAGTYKVSFNVVNSQGKTRKQCKVTVQVVNSDAKIKKATFGKQTVKSDSASVKSGTKKMSSTENYKVSGASGKLKITPNNQYKITGIIVAAVDKNGNYIYKKVKNGGSITLSKAYAHSSNDAGYSNSRDAKKYTYIYVSWKDKFTGDSCTYSISKSRGVKEIKRVEKNGKKGEKTTSYITSGNGATFSLWQY